MAKLTHFRLCPLSRSIRLALAEHGLTVELVEERAWEWPPQFLALNPAGELPVLEFDDGPTLCGAASIAEYLDEDPAYDTDAGRRPVRLFPGTREDRAEVRRLVDWFHRKCDREVSRELLAEKVYPRISPTRPSAPNVDMLRAIRVNLRYHLRYIGHLSDTRQWLAGDELSFADLAAAGHISVADYIGEVPWEQHPSAKAWYQRLKSRPSFRPLLADKLPGFAPPRYYTDLDF